MDWNIIISIIMVSLVAISMIWFLWNIIKTTKEIKNRDIKFDNKTNNIKNVTIQQNKCYEKFINNIMEDLKTNSTVLVMNQCKASDNLLIQNFKSRVANAFSNFTTLSLIFPSETQLNDKYNFFSFLSKQIDANADNQDDFLIEIIKKLQSKNLFIFVSEFERGKKEDKEKFANLIRKLSEQYSNQLKILILGGKDLFELRNGDNVLSGLNYARDYFVPLLNKNDIQALTSDLKEDEIDKILEITGGNFKLVEWFIKEIKTNNINVNNYQTFFLDYNPYKKEKLLNNLNLNEKYIKDIIIGKDSLLDNNKELNTIFWINLIKKEFVGSYFEISWISKDIFEFIKNLNCKK